MAQKKLLSVGTIIHDNENILLGHMTQTKFWDIFKGVKEQSETYLETAMRELYEESTLVYDHEKFNAIGFFKYMKNKDLYLYNIKYKNLSDLDISSLKCVSYFERHGNKFPEIDKYKIVPIKDIPYYCGTSMNAVLLEYFHLRCK